MGTAMSLFCRFYVTYYHAKTMLDGRAPERAENLVLMSSLPDSGSREEVDWIDDCHRNDAVFSTEIEVSDTRYNLLCQCGSIHIG